MNGLEMQGKRLFFTTLGSYERHGSDYLEKERKCLARVARIRRGSK